ncbi:MAG: malto-oligosyltrehalose synthase, partial [Terracoccus sp.]
LRDGRESPLSLWFDIDWDAQHGKVLMPVLGGTLEEAFAGGEITLGSEGDEQVVRYYDQVFPVAAGTADLPLTELLAAQHYRLASWKIADDELNYRRFFDVTSLIAVRVEEPVVFEATHAKIAGLVQAGKIDGLRIDHPDGLADPSGYLDTLAEATKGTWVVVEKILEGEEVLPADWACAGTTGYDALLRVGGLFVDPAGAAPLDTLSTELLGERQSLEALVETSKRWVVQGMLATEVSRLVRLLAQVVPDADDASLRRAVVELLVAMDRYRAYARPGEAMTPDASEALAAAQSRATAAADERDRDAVGLVADIARGVDVAGAAPGAGAARDEFMVRFQQTCGPTMAKAIEDTAYYRYVRLTGLNEVGGDPSSFGTGTGEFHAFAAALATDWPHTMTTLSTHDTKRSEDLRARLFVLAERPEAWADWVRTARELVADRRSAEVDALTEYFLWQTVVGAWPITDDRLGGYAEKAIRESKLHTSWISPDTAYESAVADLVSVMVTDPAVASHLEAWHAATSRETRANVLGQKLVQLTMPGVPDVYQGNELVDLSLVDPDNRRAVDYDERGSRLARLDAGEAPVDLSDEKLLVTSRALRLRRDEADVFIGIDTTHTGLSTGSAHLVAFGRGRGGRVDVVVLATRLAGRLADRGGWADDTVDLPEGEWRDLLSGEAIAGGSVPIRRVLREPGLPVALLVRAKEQA